MPAVLSAENVVIAVGERVLCRNLDLTVNAGELWGVLGCNGSGKTTLMHTLSGLIPATSGRITSAGRPLAAFGRRALGRMIGMLLQREDQEFWGSVVDYVMLGRYPHAQSLLGWSADDHDAVQRALASFDLCGLAQRPCSTLSGGERQRARLAQLWAQQPALLMLDEPLQHLDLRHQVQLLHKLRSAVDEAGSAALMVLHDLTFAGHCDRILMLHGDGRYSAGDTEHMLASETLEQLYGCRLRAYGTNTDAHFVPVI